MNEKLRKSTEWKTISRALDRAPAEALDAVIQADQWCSGSYKDRRGNMCLVSWMLTGMGAKIRHDRHPAEQPQWHELEERIGMYPGDVAVVFDYFADCYYGGCASVGLDALVAEIKEYIAEKFNPEVTENLTAV